MQIFREDLVKNVRVTLLITLRRAGAKHRETPAAAANQRTAVKSAPYKQINQNDSEKHVYDLHRYYYSWQSSYPACRPAALHLVWKERYSRGTVAFNFHLSVTHARRPIT